MSRRIQSLLALTVVAVVFAAAACSSATGPQPASHISADQACDWQSSGTCH
jgi:hypothetical protein